MQAGVRAAWRMGSKRLAKAWTETSHRSAAVAAAGQGAAQPSPSATVIKVQHQDVGKGKLRLDAFLAARMPDASRAKVQSSIKERLVLVNGRAASKASLVLKPGDTVSCELLPPPPMEAIPEAILLHVAYEDSHVIVVNKPAGMVVHISPGHTSGTLVNALLHHCSLGPLQVPSGSPMPVGLIDQQQEGAGPDAPAPAPAPAAAAAMPDAAAAASGRAADAVPQPASSTRSTPQAQDTSSQQRLTSHFSASSSNADSSVLDADAEEDEAEQGQLLFSPYSSSSGPNPTNSHHLRPGIVHRLDKGTSGLLVVAKTEVCHRHLCDQFKARSVSRVYWSITRGCPPAGSGRVETNIGRDLHDRKKMAAFGFGSSMGRAAASNYRVLRPLAGGRAALVEWRLDTGRTHQIRVHAKHLGFPLLGDDLYGGTHASGVDLVCGKRCAGNLEVRRLVELFMRPALHALTLGFTHPVTNERLHFQSELADDFQALLQLLADVP